MKSGTGKCGGWVGVSSLVPKAGGEDIYIDFQFKCNVKRGTFAYCLTHLDSNNIIMTIAELLEKERILTSLKGREDDFLVQH